MDLHLACHLIEACDVAYAIGSPGGVTSSPKYEAVGFHSAPEVIVRGPDQIDACLVGSTDAGLIVAFRGTLPLAFANPAAFFQSLLDWLTDAEMAQIEVPGIPGKVHQGFAKALLDLWEPLTVAIKQQLASGQDVFVTGHSKGASMATLAAVRLLNLEGIRASGVFPFAPARAGDPAFASAYDEGLPGTWWFANRDDIVPHLPPSEELFKILESLPEATFKGLKALPEYQHTKTLQFIQWDGKIIDFGKLSRLAALELQARRMDHLAARLLTGKVGEILGDHACEGGYLTAPCGAED